MIKELLTAGEDIVYNKPGEHLDLVLKISRFNELQSAGYRITVIQTEQEMLDNLAAGRDLNGYRDYTEIFEHLQLQEWIYPNLCQLHDIGDSRGKEYFSEGNDNYEDFAHDIWALKLSDNPSLEEDEPSFYFMGAHHAREPISAEMVLTILDHLLDNYGSDPAITNLIDNSQIWFIPLVNPDGHKIVFDETNIWYRKNIRDNNGNGYLDYGGWSGYPDGVDPNRNYGFQWGLVGASDNPADETYHGPEAFSEPEVAAMRDLLAAHHFVAGISYHTYGELVLHPFGYNENIWSPDHEALNDLAVAMAMTIPAAGGGYYNPVPAWELYPCMGTTDDYSYGVRGIFGYTIEMATQFIPPASQVETICQNNLQAALTLLDRVGQAVLTGQVTDSQSGDPLRVRVEVAGVDDTGAYKEPHTSSSLYGRYYRLLLPGSYDVTFSQYGYLPQSFPSVVITESGQTVLDAQLEPAAISSLQGLVRDQDSQEPIPEAFIQVLDTPLEPVFSDEYGQFQFPEIPVGNYLLRVSAPHFSSWVNEIEIAADGSQFNIPLSYTTSENFEYIQFSDNWQFSGNADWYLDEEAYEGFSAARSGQISHNQLTALSITLEITSPGDISFFRKVSCENDTYNNYDYLAFLIDGNELARWDGEIDWSPVSYQVDPGTRTFTWRFSKDGAVSAGQDCAWIDLISFPEYTGMADETFLAQNSPRILGNFPNPFNPETKILLFNPDESELDFSIYNSRGQLVKTLYSGNLATGYQTLVWDGKTDAGTTAASGLYFGKLKKVRHTSTIKLILMK